MTKEKKEFDKKCFLKILGIVLLFSIFLLPYNYCSDIYNVMDVGYWEYAKEWFAPAGRTLGMAIMFLLEKIQLPVNMYIFIMKILAIFIATSTIYIFYNMVLEVMQYDEKRDLDKKKYIFVAVILIFLNMASYQFFYYAESAVMWLGILFTVLGVKVIIKDDKIKYLKSFIYLFIAMNCYQSTILFFIPATILLLGIKKDKIIKVIGEIIKLSILVGICLLLGYMIMQILTRCFEIIPYRSNKISFDKESVLKIFDFLIKQYHNEYKNKYIYLCINLFSILFSIFLNIGFKKKFIKNKSLMSLVIIIFVIMSAFLQTWGIISVVNYYMADRIQFAYLSTVGLCALYFIMYTNLLDNKIIKKVYYALCIIFLSGLIIKSNYISIQSWTVRKQDDFEGRTIARIVAEYEKTSNYEIKEVIYCLDNYVNYEGVNVQPLGDPTYRIFASEWVLNGALNYYTGKDLKITQNQYMFEEIFSAVNWDSFNEKQIKCIGNTLYLCVY